MPPVANFCIFASAATTAATPAAIASRLKGKGIPAPDFVAPAIAALLSAAALVLELAASAVLDATAAAAAASCAALTIWITSTKDRNLVITSDIALAPVVPILSSDPPIRSIAPLASLSDI